MAARRLANDTCEVTRQLETEALRHLPIYTNDDVLPCDDDGSGGDRDDRDGYLVLKSRALNRDFRVPFGSHLNLETFRRSGHTLGIDQTKTWIRHYSLDLDCACRVISRQQQQDVAIVERHLDELQALEVLQHTLEALQGYLKLERRVNWQLWRRACGFHIYTDVPVTMPTHLLFARIASSNFTNRPFVLEVPSIMPLPFSAKNPNEPYTKCRDSGDGGGDTDAMVVPARGCAHYELFDYRARDEASLEDGSASTIGHVVMGGPLPRDFAPQRRITGSSPDDTFVVHIASGRQVRHPRDNRRLVVPRLLNIVIHYAYKYLVPLRDYLTHVALAESTSAAAALCLQDRTAYAQLDADTRASIELFMGNFNEKTTATISSSYEPFVADSLDYGCLNLQHWVVTLHLFIDDDAQQRGGADAAEAADDEISEDERRDRAFQRVLRAIYANAMPNNPVLRRFVQFYDVRTRNAYGRCTWSEMMEHMLWLRGNGLTPLMSLPEKVEHLLQKLTSFPSSAEYREESARKHKDDRNRDDQALVDFAVQACIRLRCFMYNSGSAIYYFNDSGTHYRFGNKLTTMPNAPFVWINASSKRRPDIYDAVMNLHVSYTVPQGELLTKSPFLISTTVGVFNSLTGLYSGHTRFLRFSCFRDVCLWPLRREFRLYSEQTADIVAGCDEAEAFLRRAIRGGGAVSELFVHAILAPMSMQLQHVNSINPQQLICLSERFDEHPFLPEADFLVEYFPLSVHYVYVVMQILMTCDSDMLAEARAVFTRVLNRAQPTADDWHEKFPVGSFSWTPASDASVTTAASAAAGGRGSYMRELLSITDNGLFAGNMGPTRELCIRAVVLGMCMAKCTAYASMAEAFDTTNESIRRLQPRSRHPAYSTFRYATNLATCRANIVRAKRIVFGCDAQANRPELKSLVDALVSLALMVYFAPRRFEELCSTLAPLFVTVNLHKKLVVYYGNPHTGKSLLCHLIELMASPQVAKLRDPRSAEKRSDITTKVNVLIVNEAKNLREAFVKSVTGSDGDSTQQFYNQQYEIINHQALVYGATNNEIEYDRNASIDMVAMERIHGVEIVGRHVEQSPNMGSWLEMMSADEVFRGCIDNNDADLANGVAWLAYAYYVATRNSTGSPVIDETSVSALEYRQRICIKNYPLCRFLADIGISHEPGFDMDTREFYAMVKGHIDTKKYSYERMSDFISAFDVNFHIRLTASLRIVAGFQTPMLIMHIKSHMATLERRGSVISEEEVRSRVEYYTLETDQQNAMRFFRRNNERCFDYEQHRYVDVAFMCQPMVYMGTIYQPQTDSMIGDSYDTFAGAQQTLIRKRGASFDDDDEDPMAQGNSRYGVIDDDDNEPSTSSSSSSGKRRKTR